MENKKRRRRLASCLQRLFTTRNDDSRRRNTEAKQHFLYHCSSWWTSRGSVLRTLPRQVSGSCFFLHTLAVVVFFSSFFKNVLRFPTCTPLVLLSNAREAARVTVRGQKKKKLLHVVQRFAYLFRLTGWMLQHTPSPPQSTRLKALTPLNHQTGPMLSWTFKCNISFVIVFGLFVYLDDFDFFDGGGRRTAWALY